MKYILIILLGILGLSTIVSAQEYAENSIGLTIGINNRHLLDKHASCLIYNGLGVSPSILYNYNTHKAMHNIEASFIYNKLKTTSSNFIAKAYSGLFRYTYAHKLNFCVAMPNLSFFLGGSLSSFFNKTDYDYLYYNNVWARAITSWYWSHSVELATHLVYQPSSNNLFQANLDIPLLSNVSRPKYSPSGDYNYNSNTWDVETFGKTVVFPNNLAFSLQLNYQRKISQNLLVQLGYELEYACYKQPKIIKMYSSKFSLGLLLNF